MKHVKKSLFYKTYTVAIKQTIQAKFYKHNRKHSQFFSQKGQFFINRLSRVGLLEIGVVEIGGEFSLSSSSSIRNYFSASEPISKSLKVERQKPVSLPGLKRASTSSWFFSQLNSTSSSSDFISGKKKLSFDFADKIATLGFGRESVHTCASVSKSFEKIAQTFDQGSDFSFADIHFFVEIRLLCLYIAVLGQHDCKWFFVGASWDREMSKMLW